ncbi:MAG: hypothetical protein JRI70_10940 [Deltaproteobacteria bacterium]|nr:hypothetical protein [Deltaproteobacteria bacterium]
MPDEDIRYHVSFRILGSGSYFIKAAQDTKAESTSGTPWTHDDLSGREEEFVAGEHEWTWDRVVPTEASPGSTARVTMSIKLKFLPDGAIIRQGMHDFNIE